MGVSQLILCILITSILISLLPVVFSRGINKRRKHLSFDHNNSDYEASGDYFETSQDEQHIDVSSSSTSTSTTMMTTEEFILKTTTTSAMMSSLSNDDDDIGSSGEEEGDETSTTRMSSSTTEGSEIDDGGVTCSSSNISQILNEYELDNHVLAIFKVNVSANERELYFFLNLARRFNESQLYGGFFKLIVICSDQSSVAVIEYIMSENFPIDTIVVVDEDEDSPENFGFAFPLIDLHVYIVDQCSSLSYIIVPPWSSAQHPYVKAALLSTFVDLPCDCVTNEMRASMSSEYDDVSDYDEMANENSEEAMSTSTGSIANVPIIDTESDDVENIEELLNNSNSIRLDDSIKSTHAAELPLRIIIPSLHIHFENKTSSYWKFDEIVFKTGGKSPHHHFHMKSGERVVEVKQKSPNMSSIIGNLTKSDWKFLVGNRTINDIHSIAQSDQIFMDRNGRAYKIQKKLQGFIEITSIDFDVMKSPPLYKKIGTRQHYEQLNKWKNTLI